MDADRSCSGGQRLGGWARRRPRHQGEPLAGSVRIGARELPFDVSPDVLQKTTVDLGGPRRVRSIEVRVSRVRSGVLGEDPVGFALIELQR